MIIPSFNRLDLLRELLDSLKSQQWRPLEAIVVDDGSTDDTASLASVWDEEPELQLRILRQPNRGPAAARNRGLAAAQGDFLYFIDSDDLIEPDGIAVMVAALEKSGAPYCVAQVRSVDRDGTLLPFNDGNLSQIDLRSIVGSRWAIHAALYRRTVFEKAGTFDEGLRVAEDSELRWRIVAANEPGIMLDAIVGVFRRHGTGQATDHATPGRMGRSMLHGVATFLRWAKPRGALTAPVARQASVLLAIAAIRMGSAGDWEGKRQAVALAREATSCPVVVRLLAPRQIESHLLFRALELASRAARRALHLARSRTFARVDMKSSRPPSNAKARRR